MKYLLDTNVLSEPLRRDPDPGVLRMLERHSAELATASIVWNELWYGAECLPPSRKRTAIEHYLAKALAPAVPVLPYDGVAARWHAGERARLKSAGTPRPYADGQIAAVANVHSLVLVTRNVEDFAGFKGLAAANWFAG